jgi:subfamily B ATP-binding cassette protein MsbA
VKEFKYYLNSLGWKIWLLLALGLVTGILDGVGISLFIPIFSSYDNSSYNADDNFVMSKVSYIISKVGLESTLLTLLTLILALFLLKAFFIYLFERNKVELSQKLIYRLRKSIVLQLSAVKYSGLSNIENGRIQNVLVGELDKHARGFSDFFTALQQILMTIAYVVMAGVINLKFTILVSIVGFVSNIAYKYIYKRTKGTSRALSSATSSFLGIAMEYQDAMLYLRASGYGAKFRNRVYRSALEVRNKNNKIGNLAAISRSIREPLLLITLITVISYYTHVLGGTMASILVALLLFYRAMNSLSLFQNWWNRYLSVSGAGENITDLSDYLKRHRITQKNPKSAEEIVELHGEIVFQQVTFRYRSKLILNKASFKIKAKSMVGLVGPSGSGKSTMVNLLTGVVAPESGKVVIDGHDLSKIRLDKYQSRIGFVPQKPLIFSDTLFNNITLWDNKNDTNLNRFNRAIEMANLTEFYKGNNSNEDMFLNTSGMNVSGGQMQRICIARELYKDVDLLIFDESTSSLDVVSEKQIQNEIEALAGKYTVILIAHRMETLKKTDEIIELDGLGGINQMKTHLFFSGHGD